MYYVLGLLVVFVIYNTEYNQPQGSSDDRCALKYDRTPDKSCGFKIGCEPAFHNFWTNACYSCPSGYLPDFFNPVIESPEKCLYGPFGILGKSPAVKRGTL